MTPLWPLIEAATREYRTRQAQQRSEAQTVKACRTVAVKRDGWWSKLLRRFK